MTKESLDLIFAMEYHSHYQFSELSCRNSDFCVIPISGASFTHEEDSSILENSRSKLNQVVISVAMVVDNVVFIRKIH